MEPDDRESSSRLLLIGEVAQITGFSTNTLRYYEEAGLVEPVSRTESGYRRYGDPELARLEFIKQAKQAGFTLEQIKELLELADEHSSSQSRVLSRLEEILESRVVEVERQVIALSDFRNNTFLHYRRRRLFETDMAKKEGRLSRWP